MTEILALEMVKGSFRPLQNALRSEVPISPKEIRVLVNACVVQASQIEEVWKTVDESLDHGLEGRQLSESLKALDEVTERVLDQFSDFMNQANLGPAFAGKKELLQKAEEAIRRIQGVREQAAALRQWLDVPPPPVDLERLKGTGGPAKSLKDLMSELHKSGD